MVCIATFPTFGIRFWFLGIGMSYSVALFVDMTALPWEGDMWSWLI